MINEKLIIPILMQFLYLNWFIGLRFIFLKKVIIMMTSQKNIPFR